MKTIIILAVAFVALFAVSAFAADPICTGYRDCNTLASALGTETTKYCDTTSTDATCKDMTAKNVGDSLDATKPEYCVDSVKGGDKCIPFGTKGCDRTKAACLIGSPDSTKTTCEWVEDTSDKPSAGEGDRCDNLTAAKTCKAEDLFCHNSVCVRAAKLGEQCKNGHCEVNTLCNYGKCVAVGSLNDFEFASAAPLCQSGVVEDNRCKPTYASGNYRQQCAVNSDCVTGEFCDSEKKQCIGIAQHAGLEAITCSGQKCVGYENNLDNKCALELCTAAAVKAFCASSCPGGGSAAQLGNTLYSVDCSALTLTKLEDNKCDLKASDLVQNCDAAFKSFRASSATSLSGHQSLMVIVAVASAVAAMVL